MGNEFYDTPLSMYQSIKSPTIATFSKFDGTNLITIRQNRFLHTHDKKDSYKKLIF